ncbi:MAG: hypothetical protein ACO4CI_05665 [Phycisphaerales bacterium]
MRRAAWIAAAAAVASLVWRGAVVSGLAPFDPLVMGAIGLVIESIWAGGVFLLAAPLHDPEAVERGLGPRSSLRRWTRFLQLGWPIGIALDRGGAFFAGSSLHAAFEWSAVAAWSVGFAGLVLLGIALFLSVGFCKDDETAKWAKLYLWCVAGVPAAAVLVFVLAALIAPFMLLAALLGLACGLGLLFLMPMSILSIARHLDWAVSWQDQREERDLELRQQVRRRDAASESPNRDDGPLPLV